MIKVVYGYPFQLLGDPYHRNVLGGSRMMVRAVNDDFENGRECENAVEGRERGSRPSCGGGGTRSVQWVPLVLCIRSC